MKGSRNLDLGTGRSGPLGARMPGHWDSHSTHGVEGVSDGEVKARMTLAQDLVCKLVRPYTVRELPGWGRVYRGLVGGGANEALWDRYYFSGINWGDQSGQPF